MRFIQKCFVLSLLIHFFSHQALVSQIRLNGNDSLLFHLLVGKDEQLNEVVAHPDKYQFQLFYTRVEKRKDSVLLTTYHLFKDQYYFYPASLIKLPLAVVALEQLTALMKEGVTIDSRMTLSTCSCDKASNQYVNTHANPNIEQILREMIIMSNNDAYNVFFDFVGMDQFNSRMKQLGYNNTILKRRFTSGCSDAQNRWYGGINLSTQDSGRYFRQVCDSSLASFCIDSAMPVYAGTKYLENGKIKVGPKDFSSTNYFSLNDAHHFLIDLIFDSPLENKFKILPAYKNALVNAMGSFPRELKHSQYDKEKIPDYYYKFFLDPKKFNTSNDNLRIYNKVGLASGFISDVSYFVDEKTGVQFFLSAAILAKKDDIINNGKYNYFDFGIPILRKIANIIYDYELTKRF